ncbi:hypothetical protein [Bartonella sp. AP331QHHD]|uniref:hypothetical protein n=1 Tax=Bartonella sp. AP331QHHD TaxID=3243490 RepID=UPI0035D018A1
MNFEAKLQQVKRDIANIFFELGITEKHNEKLCETSAIRSVLGLDSQEIMTVIDVVSSLALSKASLKEENVKTINDLSSYLVQNRDNWLFIDMPFVLQSSAIIRCDFDTVFSYIANYKKWPQIIPHVNQIIPEYDDGQLQSFTMHIEGINSEPSYFVKSLRYINKSLAIIDFAQPIPPDGFTCHKGGWRFQSLGKDCTRLISFHGFSLDKQTVIEKAITLIRSHIQTALKTWVHYANGEKNG